MMTKYFSPKSFVIIFASVSLLAGVLVAQQTPQVSENQKGKATAFDEYSDQALAAMVKKAEELKIKGAAVLAYVQGESVTGWSSKMAVVGSFKNAPSGNNKGANLLAIAYSKAAEMADTLKDSGSKVRPPLNGEFGWEGGLIRKTKTGYLLASFSGGPSEDDLKVARVGLEMLAGKL